MRRPWAIFLCACAFYITASAHVLDQYLQVAQIAVAPDGVRIELRLTPGVLVADRIVAMIDLDRDGQISPSEEQTYAQRVLREIKMAVDGQPTPLALTRVQFPTRQEMSEGVGSIRFDLTSDATLNTAGEHRITFRNDHQPELGVYLANALVPISKTIKITGQERDELQRGLQVNFRVAPEPARTWPRWPIVLFVALALLLLLMPAGWRESSSDVESDAARPPS